MKSSLQSKCCPLVGWSESQLLAGWLTVLVNNALFFFLLFSSQVSHKFNRIWLISNYQNLAGLFYFSIQLVSSIDGDFSATFECSQPQSLLKVWFMLETFFDFHLFRSATQSKRKRRCLTFWNLAACRNVKSHVNTLMKIGWKRWDINLYHIFINRSKSSCLYQ